MRTLPRTSRTGGAAAFAAFLLCPGALLASDEPVNFRPPTTVSVQEVESLLAPPADLIPEPDERPLGAARLRAIPVAPDDAQRGAVLTDASAGLPAGALTAGERAKMDAARAAVEASRAAGTLFVTELPDATLPATPDELDAMKRQQLAARSSAPPAPDPVAGVGEDLKAIQLTGPAGLTATEQAKLHGETIPALPLSPAPAAALRPGESPVGDGAPARPVTSSLEKETRDE